MFKNITGFFVNQKGTGGKKKVTTLQNMIVIVILGVIIILVASILFEPTGSADAMKNEARASSIKSGIESEQGPSMDGQAVVADMEKRLSELLSGVEGAGLVKVMIYADTSNEQVPAYNNEQDTRNDNSNDSKSSEISEVRELALTGDDTPVILKVIVPSIKGVVVVAQGADDMLIKEQLNNAVCSLLGIPEHRVQILKHK